MGIGAHDLSGVMWEWFTPDALMPSQYADRHRPSEASGIQRLCEAVFGDFQRRYVKTASGYKSVRREEREWVERQGNEPFGFDYISQVLDVEPNYFRKGVVRWMDAIDRGDEVPKVSRRLPVCRVV